MFCRKCGNELSENDLFCNKCGEKVIDSHNELYDDKKKKSSLISNSFVKFIVYLIIFIIITIMLYSVYLPKNISISQFISDPHGLASVVSYYIAGGLGLFLFSLLMIFALKEFGIINKTYKLEFIFIFAFLDLLGNITFGEKYFNEIMMYYMPSVFILGGLLRLVASFKKKK